MSNKNTEAKAYLSGLPAVLVFATVCLLASLVIALTGCDRIIDGEPKFDLVIPQSEYEMHDLTYPSNEYDINNIAQLAAQLIYYLKRGVPFEPVTV